MEKKSRVDKEAREVLLNLGIRLGWDVKSFEELRLQLIHGSAFDQTKKKKTKKTKDKAEKKPAKDKTKLKKKSKKGLR